MTTKTAPHWIVKPADCAYSIPIELRRATHSEPEIAGARSELATMYRKLRAKNPAIARVLYRRMKAAERGVIDNLFFNQPSILAAIRRPLL